MGKPDKLVAEITPEMDNGWGPSNPRASNPWHDLLARESLVNHLFWWKEELPGKEEYRIARASLGKVGWEVDYIITHCCSTLVQNAMSGGLYQEDALIFLPKLPRSESLNTTSLGITTWTESSKRNMFCGGRLPAKSRPPAKPEV